MFNSPFLILPLLLLAVLIVDCESSLSAQLISNLNSTISYARGGYLMSLNIGTPPMTVVGQVDTGSDLMWIQCQPCLDCYAQNAPIYDSLKSTTYNAVSCHTPSCSSLLAEAKGSCDPNSFCSYTYEYADTSKTMGVLSMETISIGNSSSTSFPNMLFGCSNYTNNDNGLFDPSYTGVIGLGGGPLSLVSQLGPYVGYTFSYCLVPSESSNNATSSIVFGHDDSRSDETDLARLVTPLLNNSLMFNTFYTIGLQSISIVGYDWKVDVGGPTEDGQGNIIVDSGSTLTYLNDSVLEALMDKVKKIVYFPTTKDPQGDFPLCFNVTGANETTINLPDLTFQFIGGPLILKPSNTFAQIQQNVSCFAMAPSSMLTDGTFDIQVFGYISQQNFRIEYDLQNQSMSFAPFNCSEM